MAAICHPTHLTASGEAPTHMRVLATAIVCERERNMDDAQSCRPPKKVLGPGQEICVRQIVAVEGAARNEGCRRADFSLFRKMDRPISELLFSGFRYWGVRDLSARAVFFIYFSTGVFLDRYSDIDWRKIRSRVVPRLKKSLDSRPGQDGCLTAEMKKMTFFYRDRCMAE